jgi:hypothetical protein
VGKLPDLLTRPPVTPLRIRALNDEQFDDPVKERPLILYMVVQRHRLDP